MSTAPEGTSVPTGAVEVGRSAAFFGHITTFRDKLFAAFRTLTGVDAALELTGLVRCYCIVCLLLISVGCNITIGKNGGFFWMSFIPGATLSAIIGSLAGRKKTMNMASLLTLVSYLSYWTKEKEEAVEAISGFSTGMFLFVLPLYYAETGKENLRRTIAALSFQFFIVFGVLSFRAVSWIIGAIGPSMVMINGHIWLIESPRWLLHTGCSERAMLARQRLDNRAVNLLAPEPAAMGGGKLRSLFVRSTSRLFRGYKNKRTPRSLMVHEQGNRRFVEIMAPISNCKAGFIAVLVLILIFVVEALTDPSWLREWFYKSKSCSRQTDHINLFLCVKLIGALVAMRLVPTIGCRFALKCTVAMIGFINALVMIPAAFRSADSTTTTQTINCGGLWNDIALTLHSFCHSLGPSAIIWTLIGELLPFQVRASGAVIVLAFWVLTKRIMLLFALSKHSTPTTILIILTIAWLATLRCNFPSTEGACLDDIQNELEGRSRAVRAAGNNANIFGRFSLHDAWRRISRFVQGDPNPTQRPE